MFPTQRQEFSGTYSFYHFYPFVLLSFLTRKISIGKTPSMKSLWLLFSISPQIYYLATLQYFVISHAGRYAHGLVAMISSMYRYCHTQVYAQRIKLHPDKLIVDSRALEAPRKSRASRATFRDQGTTELSTY